MIPPVKDRVAVGFSGPQAYCLEEVTVAMEWRWELEPKGTCVADSGLLSLRGEASPGPAANSVGDSFLLPAFPAQSGLNSGSPLEDGRETDAFVERDLGL